MDLSKLTKKTLKVSRGYTYTYYTSPAQGAKPTLILFHGWPDSALLWAGLINDYLVPNGYGVVALDCLGYGETSRPTDAKEYAWPKMAGDAVEILDAESLTKVISLGHDWGSAMCQRFYNYHPSRVSGLVMLNVAYMPPTGQFDLDETNKATKAAFGVGLLEYWHFFTAEDAAEIMTKNLDSVYSVAFGDPMSWLENWCSPGGMRNFISNGRTQPVSPYATDEHKRDFESRFKPEKGGFASSLCWYRAAKEGVQSEAEKSIPDESKIVNVPAFFWGGEDDQVCRPVALQGSIAAGLLPKVKSVVRPGGHWALLERPADLGEDLVSWLRETYKSSYNV
ncbi:unnamed protein product [Clonostachys rosea f. rosea IK726]|uniref:Uncharacterized protein n=1 Tax=Clonostachys rosea f. rosea IK726 TaxID=1349383 RepID=A0ACA9TNE6_BIOOC|nr:unnamed protein product [Clonostachys rosea f. rosea IK726]